MRHLVALPIVAALLASGGCAGLTPTTVSTDTTNLIQEVDSLTSAACSFVPSAETIAGLATTGNAAATSALTLASSIASVVCGAVTAATAAANTTPTTPSVSAKFKKVRLASGRRGVLLPSVNGVPITGYFVAPQ